MSRPLAVVTGVGPGTGSAIVRRLSAGGYGIAMLARNRERIQRPLVRAPPPGHKAKPVYKVKIASPIRMRMITAIAYLTTRVNPIQV